MNKELEEAIKVLDKLKENKALFSGGWADILRDEEKNAIETILEALDNSVSKDEYIIAKIAKEEVEELLEETVPKSTLQELAQRMRKNSSIYWAKEVEKLMKEEE